jgi:imidazolonepropionase-like amidohydrolase
MVFCSRRLSGCLLAVLLLVVATAHAAPRAFVGARILPIAGPAIDEGVLVVEAGRIVRVGSVSDTRVPRGAEVVELAPGSVIMPGLVDTHSHVGEIAGADGSEPIQPGVRGLDAINVRSSGLRRALAGGITTVNVMPGSGHLISGQTVYLKLRAGERVEDLAYRTDDGAIAGGLKMANGTNSRRDPPFPGTRAKSAALVRQAYVKAQEYRDKRANTDATDSPPRDLDLETLVEVLDGRRVVHHHTHRHDDVMTVLRLKEEFGFRVVLHHVSDAWKVAGQIAEAGVPVSLIGLDSPGGKEEALGIRMENAAALERAGALMAFHTDDWITDSRYFLRMAAFGVRGGMSREGALQALTVSGAKMLDLDGRVGTLERGKDADFVILSGDPLSVRTRVLQTWVEGEKRFDLDDPDDRLVAEGGTGALYGGDGTAHVHSAHAAGDGS